MVAFVADTDRASARGYDMLTQQIFPNALFTIDNEFVVRGELPEAMAPWPRAGHLARCRCF